MPLPHHVVRIQIESNGGPRDARVVCECCGRQLLVSSVGWTMKAGELPRAHLVVEAAAIAAGATDVASVNLVVPVVPGDQAPLLPGIAATLWELRKNRNPNAQPQCLLHGADQECDLCAGGLEGGQG